MQTRSKSKIIQTGNKFQTNHDMSVNLHLNGKLQAGKVHPFYIPEITDHMFRFLELSDIKNCRAVCRKWNQLAEKFLKKLSVVEILEPERVEDFNQMFPNAQQSQIFTSFRFGYEFRGSEWPLCKFVSFCEKWHHNLSELTLFLPDFRLDRRKKTFDLSPFLPSTLNKLKIRGYYRKTIISIDKICNIRILDLEKCILNITPGTTLSNEEIVLEAITFCEGKKMIKQFLINPLLNFDVLKKARFRCMDMIMDLQGSHSLDLLSFQLYVTVLNWETSNWDIKKLLLGVYPCKELEPKSEIKYKDLEIKLTNLNVSLLPEDIEKLKVEFTNDKGVPPRIYGAHNFPELKHLHIVIRMETDLSPFVEYFKRGICPKLTILSVASSPSEGEIFLKTSSVPPSVKTLRVIYRAQIIVDRPLQLESLILSDRNQTNYDRQYNNIVNIVKELHVKNLIWVVCDVATTFASYRDEYVFSHEKVVIVKGLIELNLDQFFVGEFSEVNNSEFEKSFLFPLVDTQGKYYLFRRGEKGKAMSKCDAKFYQKPENNSFNHL